MRTPKNIDKVFFLSKGGYLLIRFRKSMHNSYYFEQVANAFIESVNSLLGRRFFSFRNAQSNLQLHEQCYENEIQF
jgi:hypothetical protein